VKKPGGEGKTGRWGGRISTDQIEYSPTKKKKKKKQEKGKRGGKGSQKKTKIEL